MRWEKVGKGGIAREDERFRLLAEKTSDLVCLHEPDGRYLYISPSRRRLLGYEPEDPLGTDPYDLFPEDLERIRSEAPEKAREGEGAVSVTYRIRKESGENTWFETLTEPILGESGDVVRLQTSSRDVSASTPRRRSPRPPAPGPSSSPKSPTSSGPL